MIKNLLLLIFVFTQLSFANYNGFEKGNDYVIEINPNPIKEKASVTCIYYIQKVEVFNLVGIIIGEYKGDEMMDFSNQSRGYYIIKVYTPKGEFIKRVFKE